jgi:hypothetical protein
MAPIAGPSPDNDLAIQGTILALVAIERSRSSVKVSRSLHHPIVGTLVADVV